MTSEHQIWKIVLRSTTVRIQLLWLEGYESRPLPTPALGIQISCNAANAMGLPLHPIGLLLKGLN